MLHEYHEYRFCPVCGGSLRLSNLKSQEPGRLVCSACHFIFYQDPKVVACAIVEMGERIILLKRAMDPQKGKWVIPGGYVDRGEEVPHAAVRETIEECGLTVEIKTLLGVYSYKDRIPVVVVYLAGYVSGDLMVGDESVDARVFRQEEIPWEELAFQSTTDALRDYYKRRGAQ